MSEATQAETLDIVEYAAEDLLYIIQRQAEALGKAEAALKDAQKFIFALQMQVTNDEPLTVDNNTVWIARTSVDDALEAIARRRNTPDAD